ncbi:hypothetical protein [Xanthomonas sp. XNM01]|uniref:hypothetical protein n=1 Tax=Xanthomonas sp. XNM01 TaxID=2769289 RepID=UPI0017850D4E|nr:hypothetical protein [Xanthomonas sp. XNM01]MBD9368830.1 hypothetical protein [Xanthomonas sp. XNM01]
MATVIHLPADVPRFRAGMAAVRTRAQRDHASPAARRNALNVLLHEMQAGRSSAAAVALANSSLQRMRQVRTGGAA